MDLILRTEELLKVFVLRIKWDDLFSKITPKAVRERIKVEAGGLQTNQQALMGGNLQEWSEK